MKVLVPVFATFVGASLLGPTSLAAEEPGSGDATETNNGPLLTPEPLPVPDAETIERSGCVLNPDTRCTDAIVTAEGRDGEAEFRREPAGPTPPPMHYAVDYEVDGCDLLVTTTGELQQLPELPEDPALIPVQ